MKSEQELRRRVKRINASIGYHLRELQNFDPDDMTIEEGAYLNHVAQYVVSDTVARYWLMLALGDESLTLETQEGGA